MPDKLTAPYCTASVYIVPGCSPNDIPGDPAKNIPEDKANDIPGDPAKDIPAEK